MLFILVNISWRLYDQINLWINFFGIGTVIVNKYASLKSYRPKEGKRDPLTTITYLKSFRHIQLKLTHCQRFSQRWMIG